MPPVADGRTTDWESRAQRFGSDPRGVLFKSLPPLLNGYLHDWHVAEVLRAMRRIDRSGAVRVVDVGCGYGRLSDAILRAYPRAVLVGLDRSTTFAQLYTRAGRGYGVVADLKDVPLQASSTDVILLVATLMYLDPDAQERLVADLLAALNPGGRLLIIENSRTGHWIASGCGLLAGLARITGFVDTSVDSGGHLFAYPEIERLVESCGAAIVRRRGPLRFTFLLPLLLLLGKLGAHSAAGGLLRLCRAGGAKRFALQISYEIEKGGAPG